MGGEPAFLRLAKRPELDDETAYTILRLIDLVGSKLKGDWNWNWLAGVQSGFQSLIDKSLVEAAWSLLVTKTWLSLQRTNTRIKPISCLAPLDGLMHLRFLALRDNIVSDLAPLSSIVGLRSLDCRQNQIRALTPLRSLRRLEHLSLGGNPLTSLLLLEEFPVLSQLDISNDQVMGFAGCGLLPTLGHLTLSGADPIENLEPLPEMPSLKILYAATRGLSGIERYTSLTTISLSGGRFSSLEPLRALKNLTCIDISSSSPLSLKPLKELYALRRLVVTSPSIRDVSWLSSLPVLHDVHINTESHRTQADVDALRKELTGWETEFRQPDKGVAPSLQLEVVCWDVFERYNTQEPFGIHAGEFEDGMFHSEREWLLDKISGALEGIGFQDTSDFVLPAKGGFRRSETLVICSPAALDALRQVVTAVQEVLCSARNDWIIYCQSLPEACADAEGFTMWIYSNRIVTTNESVGILRNLIGWKQKE